MAGLSCLYTTVVAVYQKDIEVCVNLAATASRYPANWNSARPIYLIEKCRREAIQQLFSVIAQGS